MSIASSKKTVDFAPDTAPETPNKKIILLTSKKVSLEFISKLKDTAKLLEVGEDDSDFSNYDILIFDMWQEKIKSKLCKLNLDDHFVVGYARGFEKADECSWTQSLKVDSFIKKLPNIEEVESFVELINAFVSANIKKPKSMIWHYVSKAFLCFVSNV
jgi:hypothetical protein